jgi:hypothetical protein
MAIKKLHVIYYVYIGCTQPFWFGCWIKNNFELQKFIMHIPKAIYLTLRLAKGVVIVKMIFYNELFLEVWQVLMVSHFKQKMAMYDKYDSVQRLFFWWQWMIIDY